MKIKCASTASSFYSSSFLNYQKLPITDIDQTSPLPHNIWAPKASLFIPKIDQNLLMSITTRPLKNNLNIRNDILFFSNILFKC